MRTMFGESTGVMGVTLGESTGVMGATLALGAGGEGEVAGWKVAWNGESGFGKGEADAGWKLGESESGVGSSWTSVFSWSSEDGCRCHGGDEEGEQGREMHSGYGFLLIE